MIRVGEDWSFENLNQAFIPDTSEIDGLGQAFLPDVEEIMGLGGPAGSFVVAISQPGNRPAGGIGIGIRTAAGKVMTTGMTNPAGRVNFSVPVGVYTVVPQGPYRFSPAFRQVVADPRRGVQTLTFVAHPI